MKAEKEIRAKIKQIIKDHKAVLTGELSTIEINAPRALYQCSLESKLDALHWVLGTEYKSKLRR